MALSDVVIATEQDIIDLYRRSDCEKYYKVLKDLGLLPLTVETLTTERGMALVHLATWVYISGHVSRRGFIPNISAAPDLQDRIRHYVTPLGKELKNSCARNLYLAEDGGAFGRLLVAMGVPIPPESESRQTKAYYRNGLPDYFHAIARSTPKSSSDRKRLLRTIAGIFLRDKLRMNQKNDNDRHLPVLGLGHHPSAERAQTYAQEVITFLNLSIKRGGRSGLFREEQVISSYNVSDDLHQVRLYLTGEQLGCLATKKPFILEFNVNY